LSQEPVAPWQDVAWLEQMRLQLRPNAYLRLIENRWVTSESSFVDMDWWDRCVDSDLSPALVDPHMSVWVGVDASVKRDSTAIVCCTFTEGKVRLVWHRIFQPSAADPLDFEATIEKNLLELRRRFYVREIRCDPYQLVAVAQRLTQQGLPMLEFAQTVPNLTEASTNLYDIIKGHNLIAYEDADIRLATSRAVALETSRGWRIAKEKQSHKIDVVIALAQAALGAVLQGQQSECIEWTPAPRITGEWDPLAGSLDCASEQFIRVGSRLAARKRQNEISDRELLRRQMRWGRRWVNSGF
jgi:phage terminase large subunit-like protein